MTNSIVKTSQSVQLSTSLKPEEFARTSFSAMIDEKGFLAKITNDKIDFAEYRFSGTKTDESGITFFEGNYFNGKTLREIFDGAEIQCGSKKAAESAVKALTQAIEQNIELTAIGAGGIIIQDDGNAVLFLPGKLFEQCAMCAREKYSNIQGIFLNKALEKNEALLFTRSVIAYRSLTGKYPFTEDDLSNRQVDIFDENFIPLELAVNGISQELADSINAGLRITPQERLHSGRRNFQDQKQEQGRISKLEKAKNLNLNIFIEENQKTERKTELSQEEFLELQKKFISRKDRILKIERFRRRNSKSIMIGIAVALLVIWMGYGFHQGNAKLSSTKGLTSFETAESYYTHIHNADVPNLQEVISGKYMKDIKVIVASYYVSSKERLSTDEKSGTLSPAEWFILKNKSDFWQYGITHLKIDGKDADCDFKFPMRKDNKQALTAENGGAANSGDTTNLKAEYYFIHSDAGLLHISKVTDSMTLTWKGKRWLVTKIDSQNDNSSIRIKKFREEYQSILDENEGDFKKSIEVLRSRYDWIPSDEEIAAGQQKLIDRYGDMFKTF